MRFLLDVNVLIALLDPGHIHHTRAHQWFVSVGAHAWATCPLTENGVLRIVGAARYPNPPGTPGAVLKMLEAFCAHPGHEFWQDTISFRDGARFDSTQLLDSGRVTDSYLLALAVAHGGQLATMDHRLATSAVVGGAQALYLIP